MSLLSRISTMIPVGQKKPALEYFFALQITPEKLNCALWAIDGKQLKILESASEAYSSLNDLTTVTDKLLDAVLGIREIEPQKILFGVPNSWLLDENLKDEYMRILRDLVKKLELTPMAYVENSHALVHFLEKSDGVPLTSILVGFETHHLAVTVTRAGKIDGTRVISKRENAGADIEKALLSFTSIETLPSKILIYGHDLVGLKDELLSYSWMSKLSFLHFPKIETLQNNIGIKSICYAGASEIDSKISYVEHEIHQQENQVKSFKEPIESKQLEPDIKEDLGFMVGDISAKIEKKDQQVDEKFEPEGEELMVPESSTISEIEDFDQELSVSERSNPVLSSNSSQPKKSFFLKKFIPGKFTNIAFLAGVIGIFLIVLGAFIFLPKAEVKIFVEPKIVENNTSVVADPNQKTVNEENKIIPGQVVETSISGTAKEMATGKKQIGDPAKGTIIVRNKTDGGINIPKGTNLSALNGLKFTTDLTASAAASSVNDGTWSKTPIPVIAVSVGADGNLPSQTDLTISGYSTDKLIAKAEGNFSGGTSKEVTVVSSDDQKRLLASLASNLRQQAQGKLQEKLPQKKILEEGLSEDIVKTSFNKNINDQASEFSLNLTANYRGTAFEDKDLKLIVGKLVTTQVPEGFELNLEDTETQAEVSKLEKDGKLIFLARFKAKLLPKIDTEKIKSQIKGKSANEAANIIKGMDNVLGSEIKISPSLPAFLQRLPFLQKNIKIEVGLK